MKDPFAGTLVHMPPTMQKEATGKTTIGRFGDLGEHLQGIGLPFATRNCQDLHGIIRDHIKTQPFHIRGLKGSSVPQISTLTAISYVTF